MKFNFKSTALLFALIVSATLIFSSCKKPTSEPVVSTKLKTVKSPDTEITFAYNSNGTIKSAALKNDLVTSGDLVNYQVSYNAQGKISEIVSLNNFILCMVGGMFGKRPMPKSISLD